MSTIHNLYAAKQTVTITLASLANSGQRDSTVVDNGTDRFVDVLLRIRTKGQASSTGLMRVFAYSSLGDTDYVDNCTGTDAAGQTIRNAIYLGAIQMNTTNSVVGGMWSLAMAFGGTMPERWGLMIINNSGATLSTTSGDHEVEYQGVNLEIG